VGRIVWKTGERLAKERTVADAKNKLFHGILHFHVDMRTSFCTFEPMLPNYTMLPALFIIFTYRCHCRHSPFMFLCPTIRWLLRKRSSRWPCLISCDFRWACCPQWLLHLCRWRVTYFSNEHFQTNFLFYWTFSGKCFKCSTKGILVWRWNFRRCFEQKSERKR